MQLPFVPGFPTYSGPYQVGSFDCEVPISDLTSTSLDHHVDSSLSTVSFRMFYPSEKQKRKHGNVHWICEPQQEHVKAFATFLGAPNTLGSILSYVPNLLYHTRLPVLHKAHLQKPDSDFEEWPVVVFSHGLGGSRNSYSYICGSLASYGIVVIAPEHRDGSAPLSVIRGADGKVVERAVYRRISHNICEEVHDARNEQLRIRIWELGLVYDAVQRLQAGTLSSNYAEQKTDLSEKQALFKMFAGRLDLRSSKVTWIGHSFGASTMCQFVKSIYYRPSKNTPESYSPIYVPQEDSSLTEQITPSSTLILLDPWGLPLVNPKTKWLNDKPLPTYNKSDEPGSNTIAILSEAFFKWNANLVAIKQLLSNDPSTKRSTQTHGTGPHLFYPVKAAHLSQSDFGILFPNLTKWAAKAEEPERIVRLNIRAMLEVMRLNDIRLAKTSATDMELQENLNADADKISTSSGPWDKAILKTDGKVRGWIALSLENEDHDHEGEDKDTTVAVEPMEKAVDGMVE